MADGYIPSREVEVEGEEDGRMDVDTPPVSPIWRPEHAVSLRHDGLADEGKLSSATVQHAGPDAGSGRAANDALWARGSGHQGNDIAVAVSGAGRQGGFGEQGGDDVKGGEQWETGGGRNLDGAARLSSSMLMGRRDSGERSTLRCLSFHLDPARSPSPSPRPSHTFSHLLASSAARAADVAARNFEPVDHDGRTDPEASTDTLRLQRSTPTPNHHPCAASLAPLARVTASSSRFARADKDQGVVNFRIGQSPIVPSEAADTDLPRFPLPSRDEIDDDGTAHLERTATVASSLSASASSSHASPPRTGGLRARLDARSRGSIRPRPIKFSSSSRHLPEPYPTSLPPGTARVCIIPTFTLYSRFDLHSGGGMVDVSTATPASSSATRRGSLTTPAESSSHAVPFVSASLPVQPGTPTGGLANPSGAMSMTARRQPAPAWPSAPRREAPPTSHREIIARSAGLAPPGYAYIYAQTPTSLRVPPSAQWSPAFHRSGYTRQHASPYAIPPSPTRGYLQPPHSANPVRRAFPSSAPIPSSPRVPDYLLPMPPSPAPVRVTRTPNGTYRYENVTVDWVSKGLHLNAPRVWNDVHSTDCKIVIPAWSAARRKAHAERMSTMEPVADGAQVKAEEPQPGSAMSGHSNQPGRSFWPPTPEGTVQPGPSYHSGVAHASSNVVSTSQIQRGRRPSLPEYDQLPILEFRLHREYLYTQSRLLRLLLASAPAHMDLPLSSARMARLPGDPDPSLPLPDDLTRGAKFLSPSVDGDDGAELPTLWVPVPDPESFGLIVHWLYWGDRRVVEDAMSRGLVSWEGVVHNITYLGLEWPIKRVVGDWWRRWAKMEVGTSRVAEQEAKWLDEDDDGGEGEGREVPLSGQDSDEEGDVDGLQKARRSSEVDAAVEGMLGALNKL